MHILHEAEEVTERITDLGKIIANDYRGKSPLFVCLLDGAAPFAGKTMFAISEADQDFHPQLTYMNVSAYGEKRTPGKVNMLQDLPAKISVATREIVLLDDVLDSGITLGYTRDLLLGRGATSVATAVLAEKPGGRLVDIEPDYVAFPGLEGWLVGMGMDDANTATEAYRWAPFIGVVN